MAETKMMAFGEFPVVTLKKARELHFAARQKLAAGSDPMAERRAEAESRRREAEAVKREAESGFENIARKVVGMVVCRQVSRHADYVLRSPGSRRISGIWTQVFTTSIPPGRGFMM
jgi:hypothetical protein